MADKPVSFVDFDGLLRDRYVAGKDVLPNFKRMPRAKFLNDLATFGHSFVGRFGNARVDPMNQYAPWAMFYLKRTQGGVFSGEGTVVISDANGSPTTGRFAICVHEAVEGKGADRRRGWHPARCAKCGLDMSMDSGD